MALKPLYQKKEAQTLIEYMLILGVTAIIVLSLMKTLMEGTQVRSEAFYNKATISIYDRPPIILTPL